MGRAALNTVSKGIDMTTSNHFASQALERLAKVAPVSSRKVFSGVGLYHQGVLFGLLVQDAIYFRTDEFSRNLYRAREMPPFKPGVAGDIEPAFYRLPDDVLGNASELKHWMRAAVEAAHPGTAEYRALAS
jgi:DNA transformation protein and related proteins